MKKIKYYFLAVLFVVMGCVFLMEDSVAAEAASQDFYQKYSGSMEKFIDISGEFQLERKCKIEIKMDFPVIYKTHTLDILIFEEKGSEEYEDEEPVFREEISMGKSPYVKTITLPGGKYRIYVEEYGSYEDEYEESYKNLGPYCLALTGEYLPDLSDSSIKLEVGKTKKLAVKGLKGSVKWKSSDKTVASVDSKGVVKARKAGKATITATCGQYSFKCKVTVKNSPYFYNQMSKKMKSFARKNKNFTFKTVKTGKECRLYAMEAGGWNRSKYNPGYPVGTKGMMKAVPYLQLVNKNNKAELRLRIQGYMEERSTYNVYFNFEPSLKLATSNRKMNYKMENVSKRETNELFQSIKKGSVNGYATISTSSKIKTSNLKKFNTMLGQKSLSVKMSVKYESNASITMPAKYRNNWKKLVKEYNTLLKEF